MNDKDTKARRNILREYQRDLCVHTKDEIYTKWEPNLEYLRMSYDDDKFNLPQWHNPIYEVALRFWFDNNPALLWPSLHKWLADEFLKFYFDNNYEYPVILFLLPRNTFKSTFFHGIIPMFIQLREKIVNDKDIRICLEHHKEVMASQRSNLLKSKYQSHVWFRTLFDDFKMDKDDGTKTEWDFPKKKKGVFNETSILAIGSGGLKQGWHVEWKFPDDIVTEEHIDSETLRDEALQKYIASRYILDVTGKDCCSGTRYHLLDMWGKLMDMETEQHTPMCKSYVRRVKEDGALLCPNRWSEEAIERERNLELSTKGNEYNFWCQLYNQPQKPEDQTFERKWFQQISPSNKGYPKNCFKLVVVDPCWKDVETFSKGDEASISTWGVHRGTDWYRIANFHSNRMTSHDGVVEIIQQMKDAKTPYVVAERIGQDSYINQLRAECRRCHQSLILIECMKESLKKKGARIMGMQGYAQKGNIWLVCNCDLDRNGKHDKGCIHEPFLRQAENYPQVAHDDLLDSDSYAFIDEVLKHVPLVVADDGLEEAKAWRQAYRPYNQISRGGQPLEPRREIQDKSTGLRWVVPRV